MPELVWLITGCSSGFGYELVRVLVSRGDKVIATVRRPDSMAKLHGLGAKAMLLDVTSSEAGLQRVVDAAVAIHGKIDVVVNNAGNVSLGTIEDLGYRSFQNQFETNVFGVVKMIKATLPHFRERKTGTVVIMGSCNGIEGHGFLGAYAASKFALEGLAESLRGETSPLGIRTLLVEPGQFRTEILHQDKRQFTASEIPEYEGISKVWQQGIESANGKQPGNPTRAAEIIADVVRGEGVAKGKEFPFRLPLGKDCFDIVKKVAEERLRDLEEWREVIISTGLDSEAA